MPPRSHLGREWVPRPSSATTQDSGLLHIPWRYSKPVPTVTRRETDLLCLGSCSQEPQRWQSGAQRPAAPLPACSLLPLPLIPPHCPISLFSFLFSLFIVHSTIWSPSPLSPFILVLTLFPGPERPRIFPASAPPPDPLPPWEPLVIPEACECTQQPRPTCLQWGWHGGTVARWHGGGRVESRTDLPVFYLGCLA